MQGECAGLIHLVPQLAALFELKVAVAGMPRDLRRCNRHGAQHNARQLKLNQIADFRHRCDLHLRREMGLQVFARHVGFDRQHEAELTHHAGFRHRGDVEAVRALVKRQLDSVVFHHQRQPLTQHQHQLAEAVLQIVMIVNRQHAFGGPLRRPGGELGGKRQPAAPEGFRVQQREGF